MDSPLFHITEHIVPCQHIREYARATASADSPLDLVIKQYTPRDNLNPQKGDTTIIATHGSGLPKVPNLIFRWLELSNTGHWYYRNCMSLYGKRSTCVHDNKTFAFGLSGLRMQATKEPVE
jgi:hypothetical protein